MKKTYSKGFIHNGVYTAYTYLQLTYDETNFLLTKDTHTPQIQSKKKHKLLFNLC